MDMVSRRQCGDDRDRQGRRVVGGHRRPERHGDGARARLVDGWHQDRRRSGGQDAAQREDEAQEAKRYVADKLGVSVFDLSDSTVMRSRARGARHRRRHRGAGSREGPRGQGADRRPARHPHQLGGAAQSQDRPRRAGRLTAVPAVALSTRRRRQTSPPCPPARPSQRDAVTLDFRGDRVAHLTAGVASKEQQMKDPLKQAIIDGNAGHRRRPHPGAAGHRRLARAGPRRGVAARHGRGRPAHARRRVLHPRGAAQRPRRCSPASISCGR